MNAGPDTSLRKSEFISMFLVRWEEGDSETALFTGSSIGTLFSTSAHDHLEEKYTFTSISEINSNHWYLLL